MPDATDLDRAFIINGHDLQLLLGQLGIDDARHWAETILKENARPLDDTPDAEIKIIGAICGLIDGLPGGRFARTRVVDYITDRYTSGDPTPF